MEVATLLFGPAIVESRLKGRDPRSYLMKRKMSKLFRVIFKVTSAFLLCLGISKLKAMNFTYFALQMCSHTCCSIMQSSMYIKTTSSSPHCLGNGEMAGSSPCSPAPIATRAMSDQHLLQPLLQSLLMTEW